jgi:MFS family permease
VATVFVLYGSLVLLIRIFGARLPDRWGGARAGTIALCATTIGMSILAAWASAPGLLTGTAWFAVGSAFMYPAMLLLALEGTTINARGSAVGTISSCFDLSQGVGALIVGVIAALAGYRGAFAAAAIAALIAMFVLWTVVVPNRPEIELTPETP